MLGSSGVAKFALAIKISLVLHRDHIFKKLLCRAGQLVFQGRTGFQGLDFQMSFLETILVGQLLTGSFGKAAQSLGSLLRSLGLLDIGLNAFRICDTK